MHSEAQLRTAGLFQRKPALKREILDRLGAGALDAHLARAGVNRDELAAFVEGGRPMAAALESTGYQPREHVFEAIVRQVGRPVLLIQNNTYATPESADVAAELAPHRPLIERALRSVGRVEFINAAMPWGGTGWLVDERIVVTNRHVAEIVAEAAARGYQFRLAAPGVRCGARLDFAEEYKVAPRDPGHGVVLKSVRFIARVDEPDIALFEIDPDGPLPPPVPLLATPGVMGQLIAVIGYPAYDSRNAARDIANYFGDIFDVKRLAPGEVTQVAGTLSFFMHDATTLGGNSGSVVLDLASGAAMGLHFAGTYLPGNFAVTANQIQKALAGLTVMTTVPQAATERPDGDHPAAFFAGRKGYRPAFLGSDKLRVPLPGLGTLEADAADPAEQVSTTGKFLHYTHFSLAFSSSRRVPIFTAVNIDGKKAIKIKRAGDRWFRDLRLPADIQLRQEDYSDADIDRGHMVRREDPNWGTSKVAEVANADTFHYTNAAPQHAKLNQGKAQWLGLEEYILSSAKTHGLSISVFTGPILRDGDPSLDNGVQVPEEFWKVVVAVDEDSRKLRSTGYILSQGKFIADITEAFVFGQYRTYQVPVAKIAEATGLDFGALIAADALARQPLPEAVPGRPVFIPLDRLETMVL